MSYITEDGRFIKSVTDSNLSKVMYEIDSLTGLLNIKINPNRIETTYIYDEKRRVSKFIQNNKEIKIGDSINLVTYNYEDIIGDNSNIIKTGQKSVIK